MLYKIEQDRKKYIKTKKASSFLLFSAYLLLFAALFLSRSLFEKTEELHGKVSLNKVSITVGNSGSETGSIPFSIRDIEKLSRQLNTDMICYSVQATNPVAFGENTIIAGITATNELAPMFNDIKILKGSFISKADNREGSRVAVIDERMAWKLFHNDDVMGCSIKLFGKRFKIIGIAASDSSFFARIADNGSMQAYIPVETYMDCKTGIGIACIQYETNSESAYEDNTKQLTAALASIGKEPGSYFVNDYNSRGIMMKQKPDMLLFIMGLFSIFVMIVFSLKKCWRTIKSIVNECKSDYLGKSILSYRFELGKSLGLLIFTAFICVLLWRLIQFKLYISPELIPDDLSDFPGYLLRLVQQGMNRNLNNNRYPVPFPELMSTIIESLHNQVFHISCIAGSLLLFISFAWIRKEKLPVEKTLLESGIFLTADIVIITLVSFVAGLPAIFDLKGIIVFWTFSLTGLLVTKLNTRNIEFDGRE